jgi:hypothetical protein
MRSREWAQYAVKYNNTGGDQVFTSFADRACHNIITRRVSKVNKNTDSPQIGATHPVQNFLIDLFGTFILGTVAGII